jgi:broad specificity phosphatase PhoE
MHTIKLVRHGESLANIGAIDHAKTGDFSIPLTEQGKTQAFLVGRGMSMDFLSNCLFYRSPYVRTRQTFDQIVKGASYEHHPKTFNTERVYEDISLREVDHGYEDIESQQEKRGIHGWLYYRYTGGESAADCVDRCSAFLSSFWNQAKRKNADTALIVSHGITIRCFVMRFLHLTPEDYDRMKNPANCDVITISLKETLQNPQFTCGKWGVEGLRLREIGELHETTKGHVDPLNAD